MRMPQHPLIPQRHRADPVLIWLGICAALFIGFLPQLTRAVHNVDVFSPLRTESGLESVLAKGLAAAMGLPRLAAALLVLVHGLTGFPPPDDVRKEKVQSVRERAYLFIGWLTVGYAIAGAAIVGITRK